MKLLIDISEQDHKEACYYALSGAERAVKNGKKMACKDCDRWKQKDKDGNYICFSDEGMCNCWNVYTGENYFCADFIEQKEVTE